MYIDKKKSALRTHYCFSPSDANLIINFAWPNRSHLRSVAYAVLCNQLRLSVKDKSYDTSFPSLVISAFCIKLAYYKGFKVRKSDFGKNIWPKMGPNAPKMAQI